jgi:PAS domain S-box-containing protein
MFGISPDVPVSMEDFYTGVHPDDRDAVTAAYTATCDAQQRALYDVEYRTIGKEDGIVRWVAAKGRGLFDESGRCVRVVGTAIDITRRKQAEERQLLLAREVDHRARNALAVVQAIMRLTRGSTASHYVKAVEGRIRALSQAHSLLSQSRWQGADIVRLVEEELAPYRTAGSSQVSITGQSIVLKPDCAQTVALVLHELATNSAKYGALSCREGHLTIEWQIEDGTAKLHWREAGGPPAAPPTEHGFGTKIIYATVKQMGGDVLLDWRPKGLHCSLSIPLGEQSGETDSTPAPEFSQPARSGRKRVFLAEDEGLVGMMMRDMLNSLGYDVIGPFYSLVQAGEAVDAGQYDCAVLDLNLRGDLVYPIAEKLEKRGTPIIFVTGYGTENMDRRYAHFPVMQKPVMSEILDTAIRAELTKSRNVAADGYGLASEGAQPAGYRA